MHEEEGTGEPIYLGLVDALELYAAIGRTPFIGPPRVRVRGLSPLSMEPARRLA